MTNQRLFRRIVIGLAVAATVGLAAAPTVSAGKHPAAPAQRPAGGRGGQDIVVFDIVDS